MISRLIARTILALIITVVAVAFWWTWTADFRNIAQRIALTLIEGGVLVAALSLLIESFLSFGEVVVKRDSWRYFLGFYMFDETGGLPIVSTRTCEGFGIRSVMLSIIFLMTAALLTILFEFVKWIVLFLLNPHPIVINPDWNDIFSGAGLIAGAVLVTLLFFWIWNFLYKKIQNTTTRGIVLVVYGSVAFGLLIGTVTFFDPMDSTPIYQVMIMATVVALGLISFIGAVIGIGDAIYRFVGKMSKKFPVLQNVWNQFCPVRTIRFQ